MFLSKTASRWTLVLYFSITVSIMSVSFVASGSPNDDDPFSWILRLSLTIFHPTPADWFWLAPVSLSAVCLSRLSDQLRQNTVLELKKQPAISPEILSCILAVIVYPPFEEAIFRIAFQQYGAPYVLFSYGLSCGYFGQKALAIILQGLVFGLCHYSPKLGAGSAAHTMLKGLYYGIVFEMTGSLFAITGAHMASNVYALYQLRKEAIQSYESETASSP